MSPLRAVIFDLDGLLVDSEPVHVRAWELACKRAGHQLDPALLDTMFGKRVADTAEMLWRRFGLSGTWEEFMAMREAIFFELAESELKPAPGAEQALEAVTEASLGCALASSGHAEYLTFVLRRFNWFSRFDAIVGGDDVVHGKPAPDIFLEAAERLDAEPSTCIVCEDAPNGLIAARDAGMIAVSIPNSYTRRLDQSAADVVLGSLAEFPAWLQEKLHKGQAMVEPQPVR